MDNLASPGDKLAGADLGAAARCCPDTDAEVGRLLAGERDAEDIDGVDVDDEREIAKSLVFAGILGLGSADGSALPFLLWAAYALNTSGVAKGG